MGIRAYLAALTVVVMGVSVGLHSAGLFKDVTLSSIFRILPLSSFLYAVAAWLCLRLYKIKKSRFYKLLSVPLVLKAALAVMSVLFRFLDFGALKTAVYYIHGRSDVILALLLVFALGNYASPRGFLTVFRPVYLLSIAVVYVVTIIIPNLSFNFAGGGYYIFAWFMLVLVLAELLIMVHGLKIILEQLREGYSILMRWLRGYILINILDSLMMLVSLLFLVPLLNYTNLMVIHTHFMIVLNILSPLVLVAALWRASAQETVPSPKP